MTGDPAPPSVRPSPPLSRRDRRPAWQGPCTAAPCPYPDDCRHGCRAAADELTRLGQDMEAGENQ